MAALATVGLLAVVGVFGTDWPAIVRPAAKQVPRIEILREGSTRPIACSGVIFNKELAYVLTAAHCVEGRPDVVAITVNGRHADLVRSNRILDLAVLRTTLKDEEQIELADVSPEQGAEVAVLGYAFEVEKLAAQFGRVAQTLNAERRAMLVNADLIFGDSGGALIDVEGKLVGMNSRIYYSGPAHLAAAVPIEAIRDFIEHLLPKKKP
jgi:serine protease DegQ